MKKLLVCAAVFSVCLFHGISGQTFTAKAQFGDVLVFQVNAGTRNVVSGSAQFGMGDSLILGQQSQAIIQLESNTRLNFRGPGSLTITGDSSTAYITFDEGSLFLDRVAPTTFSVLTFWIKNYMLVPAGTAAAFRVRKDGKPVAAVLEGRVLIQSPTGESVEIQPGKFGYVSEGGRLSSGTMGKKMIEAIEKWSNVKMGGAPVDSRNSSPDYIDEEFVEALAAVPSAPARPASAKPVARSPVASSSQTSAPPSAPKQGVPASVSPASKQEVKPPVKEASPKAAVASEPKKPEEPAEKEAGEKKPGAAEKPTWEISAGSVTIEDEQWTRLSVGVDVPIWKFGVFFDVEAFIDPAGKFSDKGWRFNDKQEYLEAITRKIRYVRFGHEQDPVFVKVGGISNVTLGYGFIVDRFTNMLHYPDQKLVGGQVYLNKITPVGLTLQLFGADAQEFRTLDHGGVGAARLAVCPLKTLELPVISGLSVGGTFAYDRNLYAPARYWKQSREEKLIGTFNDLGILTDTVKHALREAGYDPDNTLSQIAAENEAKDRIESFGIGGGDVSVPILSTSLVSLDVYAQAALRSDAIHGWGLGAPGVALTVWKLNANLEYRHINGRFVPGFFGPYYLDERLVREPTIYTKVDSLPDDTLNGAFGRLGFDIFGALTVSGSYQYLMGSRDDSKDQRFELTGSLGSLLTDKIPKVRSAEAYLYKTRIGSDIVKYDSLGSPVLENDKPVYDKFFEKTPFMYYGYRIGIEISEGATLLWDSRFGWLRDGRGRLTPNNNISVQTAISF
jgi:hypothetical protein